MAVNPILYDAEIRHQVFIERLKSGEVAKFAPFLKQIDRDIRDRLSKDDISEFARDRLVRPTVSRSIQPSPTSWGVLRTRRALPTGSNR